MKKKRFLKIPEFPGGKDNFQKYIADNLIYPEEALKNRIEGTVFLSAEINDNGQVGEIRIEKGIGYGCDEEAIRLISEVHFGGVKNEGVRLKTRKKFRIQFRIKDKVAKPELRYNYVSNPVQAEKEPSQKPQEKHYSYSIKLNSKGL